MTARAPLPPGSTIGILGGGQLGRMLAMAAAELGFKVHIFTPPGDTPAIDVAAAATVAAWDDVGALDAFGRAVKVATYEFENVPVDTVRRLDNSTDVRPGIGALAIAQDRLAEKAMATGLGLGVAPYEAIDSLDDLVEALGQVPPPAILKTRRLGYDGKGQVRIDSPEQAGAAWEAIAGAPAILEQRVEFTMEISVLLARGLDGAMVAFDIPQNRHRSGILDTSTVPAGIDPALAAEAVSIAERIAGNLDYVGVLAVELFVVDGPHGPGLLVNEIAPRVHNSGHWTTDACLVSQFEQHIRAVAGWPLADPIRHSDVVMTNLIGNDVDAWRDIAAEDGARVHLYGKAAARPGRKMGHVNRITPRRK